MSPESPRARRVGARLAAAAATGAIVAAAFAVPASAVEIPGIVGDPYTDVHVPAEIFAGAVPKDASFIIMYEPAAGHEDDPHEVAVDLVFEGSADVLDFGESEDCEATGGLHVVCSSTVSDGYWRFVIDVAADAAAEGQVFPYTATVTIDGVEVEQVQSGLELYAAGTTLPHRPFVHGDITLPATAPGTVAEVSPVFQQKTAFLESAAAVVISFGDPESVIGLDLEGAEAVADYDNCVERRNSYDKSVKCVVTDFTESVGALFTLSDPVGYAFGADTAGPLDMCHCSYSVYTINAATLANEFGDLAWDPDSANLVGLVPAETWDGPTESNRRLLGVINIASTENPYDLQVEDSAFEGIVGDKDTVTTTITNNGPASAPMRVYDINGVGRGSYSVRVELPEGLALAGIDSGASDDWQCLDANQREDAYEDETDTALSRFDLYCYTDRLGAGQSIDFTYTVNLISATSDSGLIEIDADYDSPYADTLDGDPANDLAAVINRAEPNPDAGVVSRDYNADGFEDLMAAPKSDGALMFYAGKGDGTFAADAEYVGFTGPDVVMAGDLNSDGRADLLARNGIGILETYPGNGSGDMGTPITAGTGWNTMGAFTSAADFNSDGKLDLYAVGKADGKLYFYPGQGNGKFGTRTAVGTGWGVMDTLASVGDLDDDGKPDLLAHSSRTGQYFLYKGDGAGRLGGRVTIAASLDGSGSDRYNQIAAAGDQDGDGKEDLLAVDSRTGELELHSLNGNGTAVHAGTVVATSWGGNRLAAVNEERTYDYSGDGKTDVLVRRGSDGKLYFYSGNGTGGFGPIGSWGTDLKNLNLIETAGDFNGDGFSDLIGRVASTGSLYLFPGKGDGTYDYAARKRIGTGWNSMGSIVSGHDFDGDGTIDVIAREKSTGFLWLYSGKGDGTIGSRVKIGSGWNALRHNTAADFTHDGTADLIAIRGSDDCMYFYRGTGEGTFWGGVQMSCNWAGYDSLASVGDFNGDGHADWIARRQSDGAVFLYKGDGFGDYSSRTQIASGWTWANAIA